ncbi:MAG: hypothetical protein NXY57DRAFT_1114312 [Lentinula lateritia]|uniref:F-box domain-containing protein n=1 Tax=Lentinula lateritia TaxID=40482 RepID=A0ABQ8V6V8_9AGAR|nr:MAG: hypothetical protein NXY57DRAFT_1114312 [Lentinula lateritia]KAJ4477581.1 hypothetical protein C8R41DRAFT_923034 [Lentinula lateritia]
MADVWSGDISQVISSLPQLESLCIFTNISSDVRGPLLPPPEVGGQQSFLPNLRKLRLRMSNPSKFLRWMLDHSMYAPQIHTLDIIIYNDTRNGWGLVYALEPFLIANNDTLKSLSLGLEYNYKLQHGMNDQRIQTLNIGSLPNLHSLTLQTHDIEALCQTMNTFLGSSPLVLKTLTLNLLPFFSLEESRDTNRIQSELRKCLDPKKFPTRTLLALNILLPLSGHVPSNQAFMLLAQHFANDILPNWEETGRLNIGIPLKTQFQVDSLETICGTIWNYKNVPFSRTLTRIGTL